MASGDSKLDRDATLPEVVTFVNMLVDKTTANANTIEVIKNEQIGHDKSQIVELHEMEERLVKKFTELIDKQLTIFLDKFVELANKYDKLESRLTQLEHKPMKDMYDNSKQDKRLLRNLSITSVWGVVWKAIVTFVALAFIYGSVFK